MNPRIILLSCLFIIVSTWPGIVLAQAGGLVPCSGPDCTFDDVMSMANGLINFLVQLVVLLGTIALVFSGFKLVTSRGDEGAMTSAKNMFAKIVIGLILVLASWLIVDTLLKALTGGGFQRWTDFGEAAQPAAETGVNTGSGGQIQAGGGDKYTDSIARAQLQNNGIGIWESAPGRTTLDGINRDTLNEVIALKQGCNCTVTVTGGTESGHAAGTYSHGNGYKIDVDDSADVTRYIKSNATRVGTRSDGAELYRMADKPNVEYALESTHWDISVY